MCLIVLMVAADLTSFGFFSTRKKIVEMCIPLLEVLDGRADITIELQSAVVILKEELSKRRTTASNILKPKLPAIDLPFGRSNSEDGVEMMTNPMMLNQSSSTSAKPKKGDNDRRFGNRSGSRLSMKSRGSVMSRQLENRTLLQVPPLMGGVNVHDLCTTGKATAEYLDLLVRREIGSSRWSMDSDNVRLMNCKMNMLRILGSVANLRVNHRLGDLLLSFKEFLEEGKQILDDENGVTDDFYDR
jgi:hypothetical protein